MDPVSEFVSRAPAAPLRPYVEGYTGYRTTGFAPGVHRGLPGRNLTFIVSLDRRVEMLAMPDPRQCPDAVQAFVDGLATNAALIGHDGNQHGIAVDLTIAADCGFYDQAHRTVSGATSPVAHPGSGWPRSSCHPRTTSCPRGIASPGAAVTWAHGRRRRR